MTQTAEYRAWYSMRRRCENPNFAQWADYGGRGISVCKQWRDSFEAFFVDVGPKPSPQHSLDRIDVDGDYEPGNIRWATKEQQMRNTRRTVLIPYEGAMISVPEAARLTGLPPKAIRLRITRGWPLSEALLPIGWRRQRAGQEVGG